MCVCKAYLLAGNSLNPQLDIDTWQEMINNKKDYFASKVNECNKIYILLLFNSLYNLTEVGESRKYPAHKLE